MRTRLAAAFALSLISVVGSGRALAGPPAESGETKGATFQPTVVAACPAACDSCDAGVCRIECSAGMDCTRQTVECAAGMDCVVQCAGEDACASSTIVGPVGHALELDCRGAASCGDVVIDAGAGLELRCEGNQACKSAELHCGSGDCDWACVDANSCGELSVE